MLRVALLIGAAILRLENHMPPRRRNRLRRSHRQARYAARACDKCGRDGCYDLARLINQRGRDAKVIDWLDELTADCPKKTARNMNDPCGAKCPQVPKVL